MARRATAIKQQRELDPELLLLSAGDFCADPGIVERYRSAFLGRTMVSMRYGAVAVGERDLNHGIRALREDEEAGLPVICANLYQGNERAFPPYVIREIHGTRVGVLALLGEKPRELGGLEIRDPALEGRMALAELRGKCDRVILLAHMEREKLFDMLPSLGEVDLVIRGHTREWELAREDCADTLVAASESPALRIFVAGDRGRNLGLVVLAGGGSGPLSIVESRLIHLDRSIADDPGTSERLAAYQNDERVKQRELQLSRLLERDQVTGALVERYLGIDICRRCHADIAGSFVTSRHYRAFETLRIRGEEESPRCLACHTTGSGRPTGYDPITEEKGAPYLQGVQCEACHGPGTLHARDGSRVNAARQSCRACHTSRWSPDFDFQTYWKRVSHDARTDSL